MRKYKIICVVGARPNFMKVAPIFSEMKKHDSLEPYIVHTGQHYDRAMSDLFFEQLKMPKPDFYLGIGSGSHGEQTGKVMIEFEKVLDEVEPDMVLVVGDVNSTIACGLDAVKKGITLVHVEAGLRSFDRAMPEEINRILVDQISDYLFITEKNAESHLNNEGISSERIYFVGNVMIDSLLGHKKEADKSNILKELSLVEKGYGLLTLHRPSNVDDKETLLGLTKILNNVSQKIKLLFPVHPRTRARLIEFGFMDELEANANIIFTGPLGYLEFLHSIANAKFVLTDSGGIQEETTVLGVPCITARENTERPITITQGSNVIVGTDEEKILFEINKVLNGEEKDSSIPELWDGHASERIVKMIMDKEL